LPIGRNGRRLRLKLLRDKVQRKYAFLNCSSFKPSAGDLAAVDFNDGHPMRGISNQMHDIANAKLHGSLLLHITRV
jgi:hypothetical protein